ncbi:MAG: hypothetical protein ACMXYM_04655 [Candidatus Woesearchaeota archaeon]
MATIRISEETKDKLRSFGSKDEAYESIINRLYDIAVKEQLRAFLTEKDAVPIDEAIERAERRYSE